MAAPLHPLAEALRDRYRFERELGRGGMATVYLVHDLRLEVRVSTRSGMSIRTIGSLTDHVEQPQFTHDQREVHRKLNRLGESLRSCLLSLAVSSEARAQVRDFLDHFGIRVADADSAKVMQALHSNAVVRDAVLLSPAFEATNGLLTSAENRAADLVALVAMRDVTPRAASFLDRATHLYLWGFDPECIIMCRSVLEAALVSKLDEIIDLDRPPPNLDNLIRLAGENGLLTGYQRVDNRRKWSARRASPLWQAQRLKWTGNRIIHDVPTVGGRTEDLPGAKSAVQALAELLTILFPEAPSRGLPDGGG